MTSANNPNSPASLNAAAKPPKFYPGKGSRCQGVPPVSPSRRRDSVELAGPVEIPAITAHLGGARLLPESAQQDMYFNYPPENCNATNQRTIPPKEMPRSTTFGFGYNFDRAVQHHTHSG